MFMGLDAQMIWCIVASSSSVRGSGMLHFWEQMDRKERPEEVFIPILFDEEGGELICLGVFWQIYEIK